MTYARFIRFARSLGSAATISVLAACVQKTDLPAKADTAPPPDAARATGLPGIPVSPDSFRVSVVTSHGTFVIAVNRALSPFGADRFYQLVQSNYFNDVRFFRIVPGQLVQFGMHGDPAMNAKGESEKIPDEPVATSNVRGTVTFAISGPNTRSNQLFINTRDNPMYDGMGFSPIGRVIEGMPVVDGLYAEYGEDPDQQRIAMEGNAYLTKEFPKLDFVKSMTVISP